MDSLEIPFCSCGVPMTPTNLRGDIFACTDNCDAAQPQEYDGKDRRKTNRDRTYDFAMRSKTEREYREEKEEKAA